MKEITYISSQRRKCDKINVFLDGEYAFALRYETVVKFGLKKGGFLSESDEAEILKLEGDSAAFDRGLCYAVKKVVSEKQMRNYLVRAGYTNDSVDKAINKLKEYGYIDDEKFVKAYISTYGGRLGKKRLSMGLQDAGVSDELIEEALSEVESNVSCLSCVNKYLRTHAKVEKRKLIAYLQYRGFDYDEINGAIEESGYEFEAN